MIAGKPEPSCVGHELEVHDTEESGDDIADDSPHKYGQHTQETLALKVNRKSHRKNQGDECHEPVVARHTEGGSGQGDADDHGDATRYDGRQDLVQGGLSRAHDEETHEDLEDARTDDADLDDPDTFGHIKSVGLGRTRPSRRGSWW